MGEKNKVEFGVENLHIAIFNESEGTFKTPDKIVGTVSIKLSGKTDEKILYADNGVFFSISNNNGYDGEIEIYNYDDDFKKNYLGFEEDANGVLVEPSVLKPKPLALLFKILGDSKDRVTALYNCILSKPDYEYKTLEDKIEIKVAKIKFKAKPKEFENFEKKIVQASSIKSELKKTWFTTVYIPSNEKTIS